jgi:hypothetical protein
LIIINHQIGGINFRTESDVFIEGLKSTRLNRFRVYSVKPDIYHYYRFISEKDLLITTNNKKKQELIDLVLKKKEISESSIILLNSDCVREHLKRALQQNETMSFEIQLYSISIFDFLRNAVFFYYTSGINENPFDFRLGPTLFSPFLITFSAVMVHGAALIMNGRTAVFLASDEGGKTTTIRQAKRGTILSDDQVIIKKKDRHFDAFGTPWGTVTNTKDSKKIGGFFLLQHADHFKLTELKRIHAMEYMWNEHIPYHYYLPPQYRLKLFDLFHDMCGKIPVFLMQYPIDFIDWEAIDKVME